MRGLERLLLPLVAVLLLWPAVARAVELTSFKTDDQDKKLRLEFSFSEPVEAQIVNDYANNFVDIGIAGLTVPRNLARRDHEPAVQETASFYRFTRFTEIDDELHIRIYLGKYADPSDVQVVPLEDRIEVEMVKPFWKLPPEAAEEGAAGDAGFIPDEEPATGADAQEADSNSSAAPEEAAPPTGLRDASAGSAPADSGTGEADGEGSSGSATGAGEDEAAVAETSEEASETLPSDAAEAEDQSAGSGLDSGEFYGETSLRDLSSDGGPEEGAPAGTANGAAMQPVRSLTETPSYQQFDLNDVPVAQVQLRNLPFNEALMELVAGSGFNVIVGSDVSNELMTLDFRQKELSLKRALDLLCMAYDLAYIVEDDAIIVNHK